MGLQEIRDCFERNPVIAAVQNNGLLKALDSPVEIIFNLKVSLLEIASAVKTKMRRKARSLVRWKKRRGEPAERAMRAFINHFNKKLYDNPDVSELTWALWYFPMINTPETLARIDAYAVECIRYIATGKHTKANYKITYERIRSLGYRNLVNSYFKFKKSGEIG